jgi:subtilisin family serine protease
MVAVLRTSILVKRVEKDVIRKATAAKPAPGETLPWGVDCIDAEKAWATSKGNGVKVAVLDTGISLSHPDLKDNIKGGYNTIDPSKVPEDQTRSSGCLPSSRDRGWLMQSPA